ncbi:hypothetical protein C8Q70DRAFT_1022608 [Cubamyces menziesii]|nr:hypothetical protein C8Q70DRAFT_1022608 [Cubamyces menziesii]
MRMRSHCYQADPGKHQHGRNIGQYEQERQPRSGYVSIQDIRSKLLRHVAKACGWALTCNSAIALYTVGISTPSSWPRASTRLLHPRLLISSCRAVKRLLHIMPSLSKQASQDDMRSRFPDLMFLHGPPVLQLQKYLRMFSRISSLRFAR